MNQLTNFKSIPIKEVAQWVDNISIKNNNSEITYQLLTSKTSVYRQKPLFIDGAIGPDRIFSFYNDFPEMLEVGCYRLSPGLVFGKGLIGSSKGYIFISPDLIIFEENLVGKLWRSPFKKSQDNNYQMLQSREIVHIPETSILLMKGADHIYGHWLVDILPKLSVLAKSGFDLFANCKYIISKNIPSFGKELLKLVGIKDEQLIEIDDDNHDIYCEDLIVPSVCRYRSVMSNISLIVYNDLINKFCSDLRYSDINRKIYLSRLKWGNLSRRMVNREDVEKLLLKENFEVIYPETMSLVEQIRLFYQANYVIGEGGSALHNTIFGSSFCKVIVLQGNNNGNFIQSAISDLRNQKTGYLFGDSFERAKNGINGDFLISIPQLINILKNNY